MTIMLATGLAYSQSSHFCTAAIGRSTDAFCQYFQALRTEPMNPVERVVFSLALAHAKAHQDCRPPIHT